MSLPSFQVNFEPNINCRIPTHRVYDFPRLRRPSRSHWCHTTTSRAKAKYTLSVQLDRLMVIPNKGTGCVGRIWPMWNTGQGKTAKLITYCIYCTCAIYAFRLLPPLALFLPFILIQTNPDPIAFSPRAWCACASLLKSRSGAFRLVTGRANLN